MIRVRRRDAVSFDVFNVVAFRFKLAYLRNDYQFLSTFFFKTSDLFSIQSVPESPEKAASGER